VNAVEVLLWGVAMDRAGSFGGRRSRWQALALLWPVLTLLWRRRERAIRPVT
jgi:hypothetical protein